MGRLSRGILCTDLPGPSSSTSAWCLTPELQGESVRQLFADLSAEPEDVLVLSRKGAAADGTPIVLCALAKAGPAARSAAARSAAGSPASRPAQGPAVPALQATPQVSLVLGCGRGGACAWLGRWSCMRGEGRQGEMWALVWLVAHDK